MKGTILDACAKCDWAVKDGTGETCRACLDEQREERMRWREEERNLNVCPDCRTQQPTTARQKGDECINAECECYVIEVGGELIWRNPNWG